MATVMDYLSIGDLGTRAADTDDDWLPLGPHGEFPWSDGYVIRAPKKALELLKHHPTLSPFPFTSSKLKSSHLRLLQSLIASLTIITPSKLLQ